jgi:hypothetical protein
MPPSVAVEAQEKYDVSVSLDWFTETFAGNHGFTFYHQRWGFLQIFP